MAAGLDVLSALVDANAYNYANLSPVGHGDLNADRTVPTGFTPGGIFYLNSVFGPSLVQFIQNRTATAYAQGALCSSNGDTDGKTQVTTSGGATVNTRNSFTTSGLTADVHIGGIALCQNSAAGAGVAPEGEAAPVVANSTTLVRTDPNLLYSATLSSGDTIDIRGTYNTKLSVANDLGYVVAGVVIGKNGISPNNYGWVKKQGWCPNALIKAATATTQNSGLIADTGRLGPAGAAAANLVVAVAMHVLNSDSVSDKTMVNMTCGFGFNP